MCGIVGVLGCPPQTEVHTLTERMSERLAHRGPDAFGAWVDAGARVGLGHRRLSILDLSPAGAQPMHSADGRFVISFNGEIYNFAELRTELEGSRHAPVWRGRSDTEILLACFSAWGLEATLERINGMFAFALWDIKARTLSLARDRFGEKPLYYGRLGDTSFVFASELKAVTAHPAFRGELDRTAIALYLRHNYIPAPFSIYRDIRKLLPGHFLTVQASEAEPLVRPYWSPQHLLSQEPEYRSSAEWEEELDSRLRESIRLRMVADVPVGALLSGGIDSSAIVSVAQAVSSRPIRTFTIGNYVDSYNEAKHAIEIARRLGTDHAELYVSPSDALGVIPYLPSIYDEPFADSSQIPTFLVARLARQQVTVALSGDGGDELFGGYSRYLHASRLSRVLTRVPMQARRPLSLMLEAIPAGTWNHMLALVSREGIAGEKLHKFARALRAGSHGELQDAILSEWVCPDEVVIGASTDQVRSRWFEHPPQMHDTVEGMMYSDLLGYLPDDILVKVDRASMAVGLEARVPFLDPAIVELAYRIPPEERIAGGKGKVILRRVLQRYLPQSLFDRPKQGFGIPIGEWLRGPLREWAAELLDDKNIDRDGVFRSALIRRIWHEHQSHHRNHEHRLWSILMFQAWRQEARC